MPSTVRSVEAPPSSYEDTPPSTRPSSSASSSASSGLLPLRTTSMDSLPTSGGLGEKVEHIPTRTVGTGPKVNPKAMIFVKTGPAQLYKTATEQMKKAQTVKDMRKKVVQEEDEPDWQQNLDKWKMSRRKRNEDVLERVIEVKKFESENDLNPSRRKSKTFSEMREETGKRGRRFNLVIHDDDGSDLTGLGLGSANDTITLNNSRNESSTDPINSSSSSSSMEARPRDSPSSSTITATTTSSSSSSRTNTLSSPPSSLTTTIKDIASREILDHDNKDAKSDAGFCTGSDTGSDGVFHEDNISDTSSALGDKKEPHDSLLDAGVHTKDEELPISSAASSISAGRSTVDKQESIEYTYDKAIEGYKQYAENSVKKRTSSMTSLTSNSSGSARFDDKSKYDKDSSFNSSGPSKGAKIGDKLDFFVKEMDKEFTKPPPKPLVVMREKSPKVDITKRKTMFEIGQSTSTINLTNIESKLDKRRSADMTASTGNLRNKVASFENVDPDVGKQKGITPPRDTKFKEKLANFSTKSRVELTSGRKRTPEKDKNFHQKLASFTSLENGDENRSFATKSTVPQLNTSLKSKIASFEQLDQHDQSEDFRLSDGQRTREKSVSMECLTRSTATRRYEVNSPPSGGNSVHQSASAGCLVTGIQSTPYVEVFLQAEDETNVKMRSLDKGSGVGSGKRSTVYETVDVCHVVRDVESAPMYSIFKVDGCSKVEESKFSRGSVDTLDEESSTSGTSSHNWRPPRASRSPEKTSFDSRSQERRSFESFSPDKGSSTITQRRSQLEKMASEGTIDSFMSRSEQQTVSEETFVETRSRDEATAAKSASGRLLPACPPVAKDLGRTSRTLPCPPLDLQSVDLSTSQSEAPISTSSPRSESAFNSSVFQSSSSTSSSSALASRPTERDTNSASEASQVVTSSFVSSTQSSVMTSSTMSSTSQVTRSYSYKSDMEEEKVEKHYDDVLNTNEPSSVRSSMESDRMRYTDDDINEVMEQFDGERGLSSSPSSEAPPPPTAAPSPPTAAPPPPTAASLSSIPSPLKNAAEVPGKWAGAPPPQSAPSLPSKPPPASARPPADHPPAAPAPVVFVDWSVSGGPVAPPSEPPPPPPPDDGDSSSCSDSDRDNAQSPPPPPPHASLAASSDSPPPASATVSLSSGLSYQEQSSFESGGAAAGAAAAAVSPTPSECPSLVPSEVYASSDGSCSTSATKTSAREELRKRRSDFLGTSRYTDELSPSPSGLDALLQQQREADKQMLEARRSLQLSSAQVLSDIDQSRHTRSQQQQEQAATKQPLAVTTSFDSLLAGNRDRYTWEDRLRDDTSQPASALNDTDDGYGYHNKLEELEAEMMRHDRSVLSRSRSQQGPPLTAPPAPPPTQGASQTTAAAMAEQAFIGQTPAATITYDDVATPSSPAHQDPALYTTTTMTSTTNGYSDYRVYDDTAAPPPQKRGQEPAGGLEHQPPILYQQEYEHQGVLASQQQHQQHQHPSYHLQQQQQQQQQHLKEELVYDAPEALAPEKPVRTYNTCYDSSASAPPEPLPRKKCPPPQATDEERYESVEASADGVPQHLLTKQSRQALSAIPRSRITDGESWIRRKPEATGARDYSKHWLIQEAEQRRVEQRDQRNSKQHSEKRLSDARSLPQRPAPSLSNTPNMPPPKSHHNHPPGGASEELPMNRALVPNTARVPLTSSSSIDHLNRTNMDSVTAASMSSNTRSSSSFELNGSSSSRSYLDQNGSSRNLDMNGGVGRHQELPVRSQDPVNRNTDPNLWRNQATTYQPLPSPSGSGGHASSAAGGGSSSDKPLPDSIINTLTQRVHNKSRPGSASNSSGRPSPYNTSMSGSSNNINNNNYINDENYHDYMNTDALNLHHQQQQQQHHQQHHQQQQSHYQNYQPQQSSPHHDSQQETQQLYANYPPKQTYNGINNSNNNTSIKSSSHEHYAQHHHHQVSPTTSSSSPPQSSQHAASYQHHHHHQQQQQHHQHPKSPQSSPSSQSTTSNTNGSPNSSSVVSLEEQRLLSVSGKKKCSHCSEELGRGAAMIIESLRLFYHIPCFVCCVCGIQLGNGKAGADVRVRNHALHCHNCYSNDQGMKFSKV